MGEVIDCIAPYADTSSETAKAARSAGKTSRGMEYILTLNAATEKKLRDIPATASAAVGAQGITAVMRQAIAARRQTRVLAVRAAWPAFIQWNEREPPAIPPSAPNSGGSQANQDARPKLRRFTSTRCKVVQLVHSEYGTMLSALASAKIQRRRSRKKFDLGALRGTGSLRSPTARHNGIHRNPRTAVDMKAARQPY